MERKGIENALALLSDMPCLYYIPEKPPAKVFILGKPPREKPGTDLAGTVPRNVELGRNPDSDGKISAYLKQTMGDGTICDLTGRARTVDIEAGGIPFYCHLGGGEGISSIRETSSCNYKLVIQTARLCSDPVFVPRHLSQVQAIECVPIRAADPPASLDALGPEKRTRALTIPETVRIAEGGAAVVAPAHAKPAGVPETTITIDATALGDELRAFVQRALSGEAGDATEPGVLDRLLQDAGENAGDGEYQFIVFDPNGNQLRVGGAEGGAADAAYLMAQVADALKVAAVVNGADAGADTDAGGARPEAGEAAAPPAPPAGSLRNPPARDPAAIETAAVLKKLAVEHLNLLEAQTRAREAKRAKAVQPGKGKKGKGKQAQQGGAVAEPQPEEPGNVLLCGNSRRAVGSEGLHAVSRSCSGRRSWNFVRTGRFSVKALAGPFALLLPMSIR
ncbi:hypothetical protein BDK51DRAFT_30698 [Blyttiomyces helicus]|uniref:Protein OS-9 homolog n=1 Tax=Blyttiomyces helicus TaxID=388810 RepID=A0A4V1IRY1_9FUNG|nr:hypothetical protein BDK51DRAFT_30698 [Blyttiomyces helicus]|eukprot:RKO91637.1 hypothetical protein BDK51DRAFT_30698 [Blyttiomyces helicus]